MSIAKLNAQIQMITTLQYWLAIGVVYAKCCSNKAESLKGLFTFFVVFMCFNRYVN